jgi:hypothetical protein
MSKMFLEDCKTGSKHFWLPTTGTVLQCYSCPTCEQRIYWSKILNKWVRSDPSPQSKEDK